MEIAVAYLQMRCPACQSTDVIKHGTTAQGKQRYRCENFSCSAQTVLVEYGHHGRRPEVKRQILEMTLNGSGIRDIARVLHISPTTVIAALKKRASASTSQFSSHSTEGSKRDHH
jgi:insertion element IS1 protein InsB